MEQNPESNMSAVGLSWFSRRSPGDLDDSQEQFLVVNYDDSQDDVVHVSESDDQGGDSQSAASDSDDESDNRSIRLGTVPQQFYIELNKLVLHVVLNVVSNVIDAEVDVPQDDDDVICIDSD